MSCFNRIPPALTIMFPLWLIVQDECRQASEDTNSQDINSSNLPLIIWGFTSASSESLTVSLLIDCVSGMWFCNTCTLGCVLGLSCQFQFSGILPPINSSPASGPEILRSTETCTHQLQSSFHQERVICKFDGRGKKTLEKGFCMTSDCMQITGSCIVSPDSVGYNTYDNWWYHITMLSQSRHQCPFQME